MFLLIISLLLSVYDVILTKVSFYRVSLCKIYFKFARFEVLFLLGTSEKSIALL